MLVTNILITYSRRSRGPKAAQRDEGLGSDSPGSENRHVPSVSVNYADLSKQR